MTLQSRGLVRSLDEKLRITYRMSRTAVFTLSNFNELKSKQRENTKPLDHFSKYRKNFNQSKIF